MKITVFICLILLAFMQGGAAQTVPYTLGEGGYKVVELEGFVPDAGSKLWDLSRLATTGYETDLRFDAVSDTVFTATTNDTRQTFHFSNGGWSLTCSETPTSVGYLSPGMPVRGCSSKTLTMHGRAYQHDHYYGVGTGVLEELGRGRLIRRDGDTIDNAVLERRTVALRVATGLQPLHGLGDRPDSLAVDCNRTSYTWRDTQGRALAQAVEVSYQGATRVISSGSAAFLIMAEDAPVSYKHRRNGEESSSLSARLEDNGVTLSGLEQDFADTGVVVADVAGRVYYSGIVDSVGGRVTIRTTLPQGEVIITVTQTEVTTFKLTR